MHQPCAFSKPCLHFPRKAAVGRVKKCFLRVNISLEGKTRTEQIKINLSEAVHMFYVPEVMLQFSRLEHSALLNLICYSDV